MDEPKSSWHAFQLIGKYHLWPSHLPNYLDSLASLQLAFGHVKIQFVKLLMLQKFGDHQLGCIRPSGINHEP